MGEDSSYVLAGVAYIMLWTGVAIAYVGRIPECSNEALSWYFPLQMMLAFGVPFVLGYLGGRKS